MKDFPATEQRPSGVEQGLEALKDGQSEPGNQAQEQELIDERVQRAKATQREFVIRLYVTSAIVIAVLSFAIFLMMRLG